MFYDADADDDNNDKQQRRYDDDINDFERRESTM